MRPLFLIYWGHSKITSRSDGEGISQSVTDCDRGEGEVSHCVCQALLFEYKLFILESFAIAEAIVVARIHAVSLCHRY